MAFSITSPSGTWPAGAIVLRVVSGITIFKFGLEIFSAESMNGYTQWLTDLGFPVPHVMAYAGKVGELLGGALLALGLFTRLASLLLVIVMSVIVFVMGKPDILGAEGGFLLLLIYLHFFFTGAGPWSIDQWRISRRQHTTTGFVNP